MRGAERVLADGFPHPLWCYGDLGALEGRRVGLLCSVKCPGSVILRTFDLMGELADEELTVVSGFHSPMELECLRILMRGRCKAAKCYARCLPAGVPADMKGPIDEGRLLLLSAFDEGHKNITKKTSARRNQLVADLADVLLVPYATPDGMVESICKQTAPAKPILTLQSPHTANLQSLKATPLPQNTAQTLLSHLPKK